RRGFDTSDVKAVKAANVMPKIDANQASAALSPPGGQAAKADAAKENKAAPGKADGAKMQGAAATPTATAGPAKVAEGPNVLGLEQILPTLGTVLQSNADGRNAFDQGAAPAPHPSSFAHGDGRPGRGLRPRQRVQAGEVGRRHPLSLALGGAALATPGAGRRR